jgi:pyruvate formate lyase activating enzyme
VVYLNGCLMHCQWCHNPETISRQREILYLKTKCIRCGACLEVCPEHHHVVDNEMVFDREGCSGCGECADACPAGALNLCGESYTVERLMRELRKDKLYFDQSGGGVTLSGGECLLQADFCREVLMACRAEGIHTCIESAFFVPEENMLKVYPYVDHVFADLKLPDEVRHKKYTGQSNRLILENIRKLSGLHDRMVLRIPLIPSVNDTPEDMSLFAGIINTFDSGIQGVELLKYNYLAESKYTIAGKDYVSFGDSAQSDETMKLLCEALKKHLLREIPVYFQ